MNLPVQRTLCPSTLHGLSGLKAEFRVWGFGVQGLGFRARV